MNMKMKKRLMAFVLAFAMIGGFGQGLMQAKPAAAQVSCLPSYQIQPWSFGYRLQNEKGQTTVYAEPNLIVCHNGIHVYLADAGFVTYPVDADWRLASLSIVDNYQNYRLSVVYTVRWNKYKNNGAFKGQACAIFRVDANPAGGISSSIVYYHPRCE